MGSANGGLVAAVVSKTPLKLSPRFLTFLGSRAPMRGVGRPPGARPETGAGRCPAPLVPMLLKGGCGYEELRSCSSVAVDRRFRSPVRSHRRFAPIHGRGPLSALQYRADRRGSVSHLAGAC